jgi:hypothetical protein
MKRYKLVISFIQKYMHIFLTVQLKLNGSLMKDIAKLFSVQMQEVLICVYTCLLS